MATKKSGSWKDPKGSSKSAPKSAPKKRKSGSSFGKSIAAPLKFAADPFSMVGGTKAVVKGAMKAADWITPDFGSKKTAPKFRKKYGSMTPAPRPMPKRTGQNQAGPRQMPKRIVDNMAAPRKRKPPTRTTKPAYKSSASKRQKGMQK